jgi:hypothetical protein
VRVLERAQAVTDVGDKRTAHRIWAAEWGFRGWQPHEDYQAWRKAAYKAFKTRMASAMAAGALGTPDPQVFSSMAAPPAQELISSPPPSALPPPRGWMLRDYAAALDADDAAKAAAAQEAAKAAEAQEAAKAAAKAAAAQEAEAQAAAPLPPAYPGRLYAQELTPSPPPSSLPLPGKYGGWLTPPLVSLRRSGFMPPSSSQQLPAGSQEQEQVELRAVFPELADNFCFLELILFCVYAIPAAHREHPRGWPAVRIHLDLTHKPQGRFLRLKPGWVGEISLPDLLQEFLDRTPEENAYQAEILEQELRAIYESRDMRAGIANPTLTRRTLLRNAWHVLRGACRLYGPAFARTFASGSGPPTAQRYALVSPLRNVWLCGILYRV